MEKNAFETPRGIEVLQLVITRFPSVAELIFSSGRSTHTLRLTNPLPVSATTGVLDGCCWQIRITDGNSDGMQLEFGRYHVELWDEDSVLAEFTVDTFEHYSVERPL